MRVAILKFSSLGDIVHAAFLPSLIKKHYNDDVTIDWFVDERFADILLNDDAIDNIYKLKLKNAKITEVLESIAKTRKYSLQNEYDIVIDAQGLIKTALTGFFMKSKSYVGFKYTREFGAKLFYNKKSNATNTNANIFERLIDLLNVAIESNYTIKDIERPYLYFSQNDLNLVSELISHDKPNILIFTGGSKLEKQYKPDQYISLISHLNNKYNVLLIYGSQSEKAVCNYIKSKSQCTVLPKLNLNQIKALMSKISVTVGGDTGIIHIAAAMKTSTVCICGPTPSSRVKIPTKYNIFLQTDERFSIYPGIVAEAIIKLIK